ncbi:MAG: hypothetical protein EOM05_12190 [Clostridia bacterium]|nr:hypothetical protein [Clostridia bacterium]
MKYEPIRKQSRRFDIVRCGFCMNIVHETRDGWGRVIDRDNFCPCCGNKIEWEVQDELHRHI